MLKKVLLIILSSSLLSSCLPAAFTAAGGSSIAAAKDRSIGDTVDDKKIALYIEAEFAKKNFKKLYTKINTEVVKGRVLYTGFVEKEQDIVDAIAIAWGQRGVKEVISELKIDEYSNHFDLAQYTKDTLITSQIKLRTSIHRDIKFVNYTVITLNNIVYLFGLARSNDELEKVAEIAATVKGVVEVISHVKIIDENYDHTVPDDNTFNNTETEIESS